MTTIERREMDSSRKLALVGMGMFVDVSKTHPANFIAQGADIALRCKERELRPLELRYALRGSSDLIAKLTKIADRAHEKNGPGYAMTPDKVIKVIDDDFMLASNVIGLERPYLERLLDREYRFTFLAFAEIFMTRSITPDMMRSMVAPGSWKTIDGTF